MPLPELLRLFKETLGDDGEKLGGIGCPVFVEQFGRSAAAASNNIWYSRPRIRAQVLYIDDFGSTGAPSATPFSWSS